MFEVEISDGRKIKINEPRREHKRRWLEAFKSAGQNKDDPTTIGDLSTVREKILMELCPDFDTDEKLDNVQINPDLNNLLAAVERRMAGTDQDFTETSKEQPS